MSLSLLFDNGRGRRGSRRGREAGPKEKQQPSRFCVEVGRWVGSEPPLSPPTTKKTKQKNSSIAATRRTRACRRQLNQHRRQTTARYIIRRHSSLSQIRTTLGSRELDYGARAPRVTRTFLPLLPREANGRRVGLRAASSSSSLLEIIQE